MSAGRPPKPTEQKRKTGNPGKRALPDLKNVIALPAIRQDVPEHLSDAGQKMWLDMQGVAPWLANSDALLLTELCEKMDRKKALVDKWALAEPVLYTDKGYAYPNPLFKMLLNLEAEIIKALSLLGMTPTDRTKLGVAEVKARGKLEELLASQKKNG
jgi:P27 family predicted phage terminase small subunit